MKGKRLLIVGAAFALAISGCASATNLVRRNPFRANNETISLTNLGTNISSTSTSNHNGTFTASGYTFAYFGKKQGSAVFVPKQADNGYFYNTTAMPGDIESIVITTNTGAAGSAGYAIAFSATAISGKYTTGGISQTLGADATSEAYECSVSGAKYFCIYMSNTKNGQVLNLSITCSSSGGSSSSSSSSEPSSSSSSSSSEEPAIIEATFAETLAAGKALANNTSSSKPYKFQGFVRAKDGNNYFLTATSDEVYNSENAIELYKAGENSALADMLLKDAKVEVTMILKNYKGTVENSVTLTPSDITVIVAGTAWPIVTHKVTVAEALAAADALQNNETTLDLYDVDGFIIQITYNWDSGNKNLSNTIGDTADQTDKLLTVYKSGAVEGTDGAALAVGDKVNVVGNLQKYNTTLEIKNCDTKLLVPGPNHPVTITDLDSEATVKTVEEIAAYTAVNDTLIAKVTGVAENHTSTKYGNFHLVNPQTGNSIVVYGGYSDVTFTKTLNVYSASYSNPVGESIVGKNVTVYATIGVYDNVGQLVNAKVVVGNAYAENVSATVSVNDSLMGSATLSANSVSYGTEITVSPVPATGYQLKSIEVERASQTEELVAVSGAYKFNAQIKNVVTVTFEAIPEIDPDAPVTVTKNISEISGTTTNGTQVATLHVNNIVSVSVNADGNNGKVYEGGAEWRLYQTNTPIVTVSASEGYVITSIAFTFSVANTATLLYGETALTSGEAVSIDSLSSVTFSVGNSASATNGQVKITKISVSYKLVNTSNPSVFLDLASSVATIQGTESVTQQSKQYTLVFENYGLANASDISNIHIGPVTLNGEKGSNNSNAPKYYESGHEMRLYANNVITFSCSSAITSIEFTFSGGDTSKLAASDDSELGENGWTGEANSISFTNISSSQVKITSIKVTANESISVDSVSLRFAARFDKDTWDTMASTFTVKDYGIMLFKRLENTTQPTLTVEEAYNDGKTLAAVRKGSGAAPYLDTDSNEYAFSAKVNISSSNYGLVIVAAPFVVVDDGTESGKYYFLDEMEYSAKSLARNYLNTEYSLLSQAALSLIVA